MAVVLGVAAPLYGGLATRIGNPGAGAKVPSPLPSNRCTQIFPAMARSGLPPPFKSPTAIPAGVFNEDGKPALRSEEHTPQLPLRLHLRCRLLLGMKILCRDPTHAP